ncbi:dihydrodipicolinate synthase family protein [Geodermatophilus sp. YIM 151500]|uniref:dihydrodipicolinate synthase family protein n=1 Tax=Geodermatophilus sp. YIM 151500 TaxID=2984531 RepID=UPI0021E47191|nr:dihydrodipicolinate synthase family protein [Geodermatophilus sp. YIM 151500]MCV2489302.1 dihydrodipicolinate synthase family protein [Geodermatophilus sp. YIM 151500]
MPDLDFQGVLPATITPFTADGELDVEGLRSYMRWMKSVPGVTGVVVNGHAGEGTSLTQAERLEVIRRTKEVLGDGLPVIAGVGGDGTRVVAEEAAAAADAGADALLVFPAPSWLRFGYQEGAPHERYRSVHQASGLPTILFQFPIETHASYPLQIVLELCDVEGVVAIKEGGRNMIRWDTDVPVIRRHFPHIPILTCQDEFLLHSMWESDGALVGYGALVPELMVELLARAKAHDYDAAKAVYDRMAPLTKVVYHRASHIESTPAMKIGLVLRGLIESATVRAPLMPLDDLAVQEIGAALKHAGIETA